MTQLINRTHVCALVSVHLWVNTCTKQSSRAIGFIYNVGHGNNHNDDANNGDCDVTNAAFSFQLHSDC